MQQDVSIAPGMICDDVDGQLGATSQCIAKTWLKFAGDG